MSVHDCFAVVIDIGSTQEGFGSFRFVSVRGNRTQGRFGSCNGWFVSVRTTLRFGSVRFGTWKPQAGSVRFVSVRVTLRFGSFRFVVCSVAGREVFDRLDEGFGF